MEKYQKLMASRDKMQEHIFKELLSKYNSRGQKIINDNERLNMFISYTQEDIDLFKNNKFAVLKKGNLYPRVMYKLIKYIDEIYVLFLGMDQLHLPDRQDGLSVSKKEYEELDNIFLTNILYDSIKDLNFKNEANLNNIFDDLTGKDYEIKYEGLLESLAGKITTEDLKYDDFKKPEMRNANIEKLESLLGKSLLFEQKRNFNFEYDVKAILKFLEQIIIFKVDSSIVFIGDFREYEAKNKEIAEGKDSNSNEKKAARLLDDFTYKLLIYIFSQINFESTLTLSFSQRTKEKILELISLSSIASKTTIYENLFNAISSVHWQNVYLCLYKEIEYNFPKYANAIKLLKQELASIAGAEELDTFQLAAMVEKTMGWRPKEEETIVNILNLLVSRFVEYEGNNYKENINNRSMEPEILKNIYNIVKEDSHKDFEIKKTTDGKNAKIYDMGKKSNYTAKRMYKIRNKIVHSREALRENEEEINFSNELWENLIYNQLIILEEIVKK